jgi:hypothetical protein
MGIGGGHGSPLPSARAPSGVHQPGHRPVHQRRSVCSPAPHSQSSHSLPGEPVISTFFFHFTRYSYNASLLMGSAPSKLDPVNELRLTQCYTHIGDECEIIRSMRWKQARNTGRVAHKTTTWGYCSGDIQGTWSVTVLNDGSSMLVMTMRGDRECLSKYSPLGWSLESTEAGDDGRSQQGRERWMDGSEDSLPRWAAR